MMLSFQMSFVENVWSGANQVTYPFQVPSIAGYERIMLKSGYWSRIFFFFSHNLRYLFIAFRTNKNSKHQHPYVQGAYPCLGE